MNKKNQKFKNAGSPPGGIQPNAPGWSPLLFKLSSKFIIGFLSSLQSRLQDLRYGVVADKTPGGIGFVLNFWFFLFKQKEL